MGVQITVVIVAILAANALTGAWASVMVAVAAIGTQAWFEALQPMIAAVHHGAESKVATSRLIALADEPIPVVEPNAPKPFNANREITFTDVSFGYDEYRHIYENLRLHIQQGKSMLSLVLVGLARRHYLICLRGYMIMVDPFV